MIVAVDLDGVVTNWAKGFSTLCNIINPLAPIIEDNNCPAWVWQDWYGEKQGIEGKKRDEIIENAWEMAHGVPFFWTDLDELFPEDMPRLREHYREWPIVFMTRREGVEPMVQTWSWLHARGVEEPLIIRVRSGEEKGEWCKKLGITTIIEDSPKYADEILEKGVKLIMLKWPYNEQWRLENIRTPGWYEADTLGHALSLAALLRKED